ncbi:hypothetical protein [Sutcliffiella rhizosphaerae]|uniref:Intracellular proteinase inhibitor BsuPI domain-containing protein n=1 Tax=Sutcliffiella rhizosphaerae TaxID=2880967 RepID=A0ABM8YM08_9BACI|nr:hypothetical protein [Sutcliffiella rhizosphaerae]CAG9620907.1 hypothetical protein BACCIP111883_01679 [Sutcliffiella rhizosphaerae]
MKLMLNYILLIIILVFGLFGCGKNNTSEENVRDDSFINNDSQQINDDFKVSINVENSEKALNVYATITYTGEEAEKDIYHSGRIFFFNVYQQDGGFDYIGDMDEPQLTTTLFKNEPHIEIFNVLDMPNLNPGTYKFEAIASFSLSSELASNIEIPVSKIEEID